MLKHWLWTSLLLIALVPYTMGSDYPSQQLLGGANTWSSEQTFNDDIVMGQSAARMRGGSTSFNHRNNADTSNLLTITEAGLVGIVENTNSDMTIGLTVNQGANDNEILSFKSSDVAHGGIGVFVDMETDSYTSFTKRTGEGGLIIEAVQDSTTIDAGLVFTAIAVDADVDAVSTANAATMEFYAVQHDSAGTTGNMEAGAVVFAFKARVGGINRNVFVIDEDGDLFSDSSGTVNVFDNHNDMELLLAYQDFRVTGQHVTDWATMKANYQHTRLVNAGLIADTTEEDWNAGVRPLYGLTTQFQLLTGTAKQEHGRMEALMDVLEEDPAFRGKMSAAMQTRGVGHLARP